MQNARKDIINFFEKGIFPYRGNVFKTKEESEENNFFEHIRIRQKILTIVCFIILIL